METEHTITFCDIPAKRNNVNLIKREKKSDKPKLRDILQNKWSVIFKYYKIFEVRN